jgi:hypothetical protein
MTSGGCRWRNAAIAQDGHDVLVREIEDDLQRVVRYVDEECGVHIDLFGSIGRRRQGKAPGGIHENVMLAKRRTAKRVEASRLTSHLFEERLSLGHNGDEIGCQDRFCPLWGGHHEAIGELSEELYGIDGIACVFIFLEEGFDNVGMRWHKAPFE